MAGFNLRSPATSVGGFVEIYSIVETAARVVMLIIVACFAVFLRALWSPKTTILGPPNVQRSQHAFAGQKKKGGRAKRNKKVRGSAAPKITHDEDTWVEKAMSSSDVEAPTHYPAGGNNLVTIDTLDSAREYGMQFNAADAECGGNESKSETSKVLHATHDRQGKMRRADVSCGCAGNWSEALETPQIVQDLAGLKADVVPCVDEPASSLDDACPDTDKKDSLFCDICARPDVHFWGCAAHRTYTGALLLMHRDLRIVAERGPPGLELPATGIRATTSGLTSIKNAIPKLGKICFGKAETTCIGSSSP